MSVRRRCVVFVLLVTLLLAELALPTLAADSVLAAKQKTSTLQVGKKTLSRCKEYPKIWCGSINVPLDRDEPGAATIKIGFIWRPAQKRSKGTLVANEGGPGYPSVASLVLWRGMYGPLLKDHDLLVVDARGTGMSRTISCNGLQDFDEAQTDQEFFQAIADCGGQLDGSFKRKSGGYVHASDLFGTVDAVDDMAAVITALKAGPIDLYGDSYGTFFAQAFAARHPEMLRSLALDGAWPLVNANPWYPETPATIRFAFDAVCERSVSCRTSAPGSATARLAALASALEANPISGEVARAGRNPEQVTVAATDLAAIAWSAGSDGGIYRELDAAGRAALEGDTLPLLRLAARTGLNGTLSGGWPANLYSVGHAVAVPCTDYPQPYDMRASSAVRQQQFDAAVAALPSDQFAPFTVQQWLQNPIQDYNQCVPWPALQHTRELAPNGFPLVPATLPVLILAGDLDSTTALGGAEMAQQQLGPSARLVVFPSSTHVVAQGDIVGCGSSILRAFIRSPQELPTLDVSCAKQFPEIRAVGVFPQTLAEQTLPTATQGNQATVEEQRLAALAVATAGDAMAYAPSKGKKQAGLRGGTISTAKSKKPRVITLNDVRYAHDVAVSGTVKIPKKLTGPIVANLTATADNGSKVTITATWQPLAQGALATVEGTAGAAKTPLRITMPAP